MCVKTYISENATGCGFDILLFFPSGVKAKCGVEFRHSIRNSQSPENGKRKCLDGNGVPLPEVPRFPLISTLSAEYSVKRKNRLEAKRYMPNILTDPAYK